MTDSGSSNLTPMVVELHRAILGVVNKLLTSPETILYNASNPAVLRIKEDIKKSMKILSVMFSKAVLQARFYPGRRTRRASRSNATSCEFPLYIDEVYLDQMYVQLSDILDPRIEALKPIGFQYIDSFEKKPCRFDLVSEGDDISCSTAEEEGGRVTSDAIIHGASGGESTDMGETREFEDDSEYPSSVQSSTAPPKDLFDYDEMNKFVEEAETNEAFDNQESEDDDILSTTEHKQEKELDRLLDVYERNISGSMTEEDVDGESLQEQDEEDVDMLPSTYSACQSRSENKKPKSQYVEVPTDNSTSLVSLIKKDNKLAELLDTTERELVSDKHWSLRGEVTGKSREVNSLLELHLNIPQYLHHHHDEEQVLGMTDSLGIHKTIDEDDIKDAESQLNASDSAATTLSKYIEKIVVNRIRYLLFDDVVRKHGELPSKLASSTATTEEPESLEFKKSKIGLADLYAGDYTKQVLGSLTTSDVELNNKCAAMVHLFETIMYKLDALSCNRVLPKPVQPTGSVPTDALAITVEDTIPTVVSEMQRKAPQEILPPTVKKPTEEMTREERKSFRRTRKMRRKNKERRLVTSGQMSLREAAKRSLHLKTKNRQEKEDKIRMKQTGISNTRANKTLSYKGRQRTADLLAGAVKADRTISA